MTASLNLSRKESWSLPLVAALVAAAVLLSAGVLMAIYEEQLYSAQQLKDVRVQAQILAASVTAAIVFDDASAVQEHLEALRVNPELEAAGVYDRGGRLLAFFARDGARLPKGPAVAGAAVLCRRPCRCRRAGHAGGRPGGHGVPARRHRTGGAAAGALCRIDPSGHHGGAGDPGAVAVPGGAGGAGAAIVRRQCPAAPGNGRAPQVRGGAAPVEQDGSGRPVVGGIAHDFNNLIMIVKGNLRLLRKRLGPDAERADNYITSADEALDRAAALTQRILAFSRRQPLSPMPVKLSDLVAGMAELIRHSVGEKVEIRTRLEAQWWTRCDINQMENVILNLAINARDAMPEGGALFVETRDVTLSQPPPETEDLGADFVAGDYVALTLRDTGTGMSEEVRRRAVDPFFTTKPLGKGTGLGLSMTFGFVRQTGGYLTIESKPGAGAAVTLHMPRYQEGTV